MDRLERALARVEIASDRRLSRLENVMVDLQSTMGSLERTVGSLQGTVDKLTVRVTAFIESQKEVNDAITTALKTFDRRNDHIDRRVDHIDQTVDRLARTVDRFLRARANGHNGR